MFHAGFSFFISHFLAHSLTDVAHRTGGIGVSVAKLARRLIHRSHQILKHEK
jgi:hypothetical protein